MMSSRTMQWLVAVLGGALLASLAACGSSDSGDSEAASHNESSERNESAVPVQESAFGDMVGTMDRARGVETTEMERKEALDRAVDQNAGSAPAE